jgi:hypothetical protein
MMNYRSSKIVNARQARSQAGQADDRYLGLRRCPREVVPYPPGKAEVLLAKTHVKDASAKDFVTGYYPWRPPTRAN